jgi:hypothetical protein
MNPRKLNDSQREDWIANDEGLYDWHRLSGLSVRAFMRKHRAELDDAITKMMNGDKRQHFLKYG